MAVGFKGSTSVEATLVKEVISLLLQQCLEAPLAPRVGGASISTVARLTFTSEHLLYRLVRLIRQPVW